MEGIMKDCTFSTSVEKWDVFEISVHGYSDKNPFVDYGIQGIFINKNEKKEVNGFYDGEGIYKVRFMPSFEGEYSFQIIGSFSAETFHGTFLVKKPSAHNHGPVRVANTYHFAYEDGTPHISVGTTCYAWTHQAVELQEKTLETLKKGYFNKIRFCILPKHYDYNIEDPITFPYVGEPCNNSEITKDNFFNYKPDNPENKWDFTRFNPEHFRLFEKRIKDLMDLGIEADLIVMHAYDRWGFSEMNAAEDDLYWRYVIARFSAYRNVWWSLANEFDLLKTKTITDWERYASIICEEDHYHHLRSIHNAIYFYDYSKPWVTHCSIQRQPNTKMIEKTDEWRTVYQKPVVIDEMCYEGNIDHEWGCITGQEMVRRFWEVSVRGGYPGHGETYVHPENILWWSHGGELHGESPERIKFLYKILSEGPVVGLKINVNEYNRTASEETIRDERNYRLIYLGVSCPAFKRFHFDDLHEYEVDVIDTWDMTILNVGIFKGKFEIKLPSKVYMAIRIRKVIN